LSLGAADDAIKHNDRESKHHQNRHQKNCDQNSHMQQGLISEHVRLQYAMRWDLSLSNTSPKSDRFLLLVVRVRGGGRERSR